MLSLPDNAKEIFIEIDGQLGLIEVKGDSVRYMFRARALLENLFKSISEIKEKKMDEKEEK